MEYCVFVEPQQGASYADQLAFASLAEELGFDGFFRSDHLLVMGSRDGLPGPTESWTTLAGLARETSRIRLGTLVSSATFRHPSLLALQVAQVDDMSGGRAELGLGTGWYADEHAAYGIPFPARRFGLLEESLEIITGLWNTPRGASFSHDGEHFTLVDSPALPKPKQQQVPIIVGGGGLRRTPELAVRFATEFNIGFRSPEVAAVAITRVRDAARMAGRDPKSLKYSVAGEVVGAPNKPTLAARAESSGRDDIHSLRQNGFVGTAEEIVARVGQYRAAGAQRIYFQFLNLQDLDHLDFVGREVLSRLRS